MIEGKSLTATMKQALEALEKSNRFVWHYAHSKATARIAEQCDEAITSLRKAIAELESQETVALEALVMICVKCRSNEWGPDTPRKQILNWFHDTASKALEDAQIFRGQA